MTTCTPTAFRKAVTADLLITFGTSELAEVKNVLKARCDSDGGARVQGGQFIFRYSANANGLYQFSVSWKGGTKALDNASFYPGISRMAGDPDFCNPVFGKPWQPDFMKRLAPALTPRRTRAEKADCAYNEMLRGLRTNAGTTAARR